MDFIGDIDLMGLLSVIIFYFLILGVGMWAATKKSNVEGVSEEEETMLAGRNIGMFVGIFTMTATWVGGGYINGTAEVVFNFGLVWCQAPFGYALSLMLGGIFFANKMRTKGYVTMLDPLQDAYGSRMGGLLFLPALCGEVFWSAGILAALGATLAIIIRMEIDTAVIMSALIAVFYTWIGGLYSVAYTDVVQLGCIFVGLWICIPFAWSHPAVEEIVWTDWTEKWIGEIGGGWWNAHYADYFLLLTFGGIPWQVYFQRVLSSKSANKAELLSYIAAVGCILMAVPPVLIGGIAKATDWNKTDYVLVHNGVLPIPKDDTRMILPMVLQYLTPPAIAFFGLGAVSAAVMSSADSSVLSASSMFARNVYKLIFRQGASEREIMWVMRIAIFVVGGMATVMALTIPTIYGLWALCSDLVYVILFPQLLMVVHFKEYCNTYGSLFAYCLGLLIRLCGGEKLVRLPPLVYFPGYAEPSPEEVAEAAEMGRRAFGTQLFPFRTMAMLLSMFSLITVSILMSWLFKTNRLGKEWDLFKCVVNIPDDQTQMDDPEDDGEMIGMTRNEVKKYSAVDEINNGCISSHLIKEEMAGVRKRESVNRGDSAEGVRRAGSVENGDRIRKQTSTEERILRQQNSVDPTEIKLEDKPDVKRRVRPLSHIGRRESLKQIKQGIKEGVAEVKEVLRDAADHLPDGHRGSIASISDRPRYKKLEKDIRESEKEVHQTQL